ncbi:MAG TPA: NAD(P)(+) transhydrogenase (Re/Si-specific) subunit beta [Candidatus Dormibacteraeota bacterium]|nr:NAD(P)(+) transhydrogenase (Re/Si-specific) subunit beta [Candidatus Dormibacteraeota bacterium]
MTALAYLVAASLFVLGLKQLSSPRGARRGNLIAAVGMVLALGITLPNLTWTAAGVSIVVGGVTVGGIVGAVAARRVQMTAMPQMVALFNGVGGGAAALLAVSELLGLKHHDLALELPSDLSIIIGSISFAGSCIAFAKLQELMTGTPITYPGQQIVNAGLALAIVALAVGVLIAGPSAGLFLPLLAVALVLGVAFVLPIGGADMPVVISLLNAFTGLAVAASGFVLSNFALIVAGTLVGASGTILTTLMSSAMGRSLANVLFGAFGSVAPAGAAGPPGEEGRSVRSGNAEDIGTLLAYSRSVIIVPGYGLAVAQAQHAARELADQLEARGVEVRYAIHPVAGRMPGHMNVLLAEANVPYEQLKEMDEINDDFKNTDVVMVVGANDVVNPAAHDSPSSPIYGMPVLRAEDAANIIFMKRSMRPGFAGIDNELMYNSKTTMLFGDAKETLTKLVAAVKAA